MNKLKQTKIPVTINEDNLMKIALEQGIWENEFNWKLVRERDNLTNHSVDIKWIEWDEDGSYLADYQEPAIGRSLLMGPFNQFFNWQTTDVTEIVEQREDYVKFKTKNSIYELFKLK